MTERRAGGIIEAASLQLPVIDVGERQRGRLRPRNVLHVGEELDEVAAAVRRALRPEFRQSLAELVNPYGDGDASRRIVRALLDAPLDRLKRKPLMEAPTAPTALDSLVIDPDATLGAAMAAIQEGGAQIIFAIDGDERLVGSLTDGDVRRALLAGASLDAPLGEALNRLPVVASPGDDAQAVVTLMERNGISQVPVVDEQGKLVGIHLMRAIVGEALDASILGLGGSGGENQ